MTHDIPTGEIPAGWVVSTNIDHHIAFLFDAGDGRSIAVKPYGPREADRWKCIGVASYAPGSPIFSEDEPLSDAISTAIDVMQSVVDDAVDEIEPVGTINVDELGEDVDADSEDTEGDQQGQEDSETDEPDVQADLQQYL